MSKFKTSAVALLVIFGLSGASVASATKPHPVRVLQTLTTGDYEPDVPPSEVSAELRPLRELILERALEQLHIAQDCTDLVQNTLATLGITQRRDQGGFDYGTDNVASAFGYQIPASEAQPGDIATIGPRDGGHVWVIVDPATNLGVHGGWKEAGWDSTSAPEGVTLLRHATVPLEQHVIYRLYE